LYLFRDNLLCVEVTDKANTCLWRKVSMNANPNELVAQQEQDTDVVHEAEETLVEVGAVTETKSGFFGPAADSGGGFRG
jgi:hypothetical protein